MRVVYSARHRLHAPGRELFHGRVWPAHEVPARAESIREALAADPVFTFAEPTGHGSAPLEAVHDPAMLRFLESAWGDAQSGHPAEELVPSTFLNPWLREGMDDGPVPEPPAPAGRLGRWCFDTSTPIGERSYDAARIAANGALTAADLVLAGERAAYALVRPPGHHAARATFGGFCLLNNAAIAAEHLVRCGAGRVAVLDVDYHHGNGTQQIFYRRGDVLTVSLHADPAWEYPYHLGFADERGAGAGRGANVNVPLPAGCDGARYLAELDRALEIVTVFAPEAVVVALGLDTYEGDPIADFSLVPEDYDLLGARLAALALPLVIVQEGGYAVDVLGDNVRRFLRGAAGPARPTA